MGGLCTASAQLYEHPAKRVVGNHLVALVEDGTLNSHDVIRWEVTGVLVTHVKEALSARLSSLAYKEQEAIEEASRLAAVMSRVNDSSACAVKVPWYKRIFRRNH